MSRAVRFEILGPQRAWYGERELDTGPGKQRAVLAVLLLSPGRAVPTGQIVEAVWPEEPPANGPNVVQKYVAGLRRVLEPDRSPRTPGQVLSLTEAGYLLRVPPESVDAVRFERAVHRVRRLRSEGRLAEAVAELRPALELWQGEPLAGLPGLFFESSRHRLVELRASALEMRVELELELGRDRELAGELAELVVEFPLRERLRHHLMLALHRSGRKAEALAAYRQFAELLRNEFGIEPGEELQTLHRRILRSDPALRPPEPRQPSATAEAPGAATGAPADPAGAAGGPPGPSAGPPPEAAGAGQPLVVGPVAPPEPVTVPAAGATTGASAPSTDGVPEPAASAPFLPAGPGVPAWSAAQIASAVPGGPAAAPPWPATSPVPGPPMIAVPPTSAWPPAEPPAGRRHESPRWVSNLGTALALIAVLLSFGTLAWLVMLFYAFRRRSGWLVGAAAVYLGVEVLLVVRVALSPVEAEPTALDMFAIILAMGVWVGGAGHALVLNRSLGGALRGEPTGRAARAAEEQRVRREQARYLLHHHPAARHQLAIGRPDLPRAFDDGGLVDVNAVADHVLAALPGLTTEQRRQIVTDRWLRGPYGSVEELAGRCLLPPTVTDTLRETLLFLPPLGAAERS
ncbi:AfsR/SARP family transcriptional regulator [Micromonospora musae]|uniref:AfsR/SARP family transcriptional regulator n=1 Tax=Micromonospora musae TaxID=1894970 RepID=UPI0033C98C3D